VTNSRTLRDTSASLAFPSGSTHTRASEHRRVCRRTATTMRSWCFRSPDKSAGPLRGRMPRIGRKGDFGAHELRGTSGAGRLSLCSAGLLACRRTGRRTHVASHDRHLESDGQGPTRLDGREGGALGSRRRRCFTYQLLRRSVSESLSGDVLERYFRDTDSKRMPASRLSLPWNAAPAEQLPGEEARYRLTGPRELSMAHEKNGGPLVLTYNRRQCRC
jgi:hypothetical protein